MSNDDIFNVEFTDTEQRLFLCAMARERKICVKEDENYPYGIKLAQVCDSIERKVKHSHLWGC